MPSAFVALAILRYVTLKQPSIAKERIRRAGGKIKEDCTPEELHFHVPLDWCVDLCLTIAQATIDGKTIFFLDENALAAFFEHGIAEAIVKRSLPRPSSATWNMVATR